MSSTSVWRISFLSANPLLNHSSSAERASIPVVFSPNAFNQWRRQMGSFAYFQYHHLRFSSMNHDQNVKESSDKKSVEQADSTGEENHREESLTTYGVFNKLKRYGMSGVLSYGLLNTAYYLSTFLFVWLYVAPVPGRMGYIAAAERFLKVLAMVWAGSQVTKLIRAAGALALAPAVDRGLSWFTAKFNFESQGKAFLTIAGFCFGLAFVVFLVVTLLWA